MADSFKIKGSDFDNNGTTLKIGQQDMKELAKELLRMEGTKYGSMAEVLFTSVDVSGNIQNFTGADLGFSASTTLTGVSKTEVVNKNITIQNKDAASIKNIKSFAGQLGLIQAGKMAISYAVSNYGNLFQDPLGQAQIQNFQNAIAPVNTIAMSTAAGGWWGFAAGVVIEASRFGIDAVNRRFELERNAIGSQIQYARAGINSRNSGGR